MSGNRKGPVVDHGVCRCCGASKKCRILNVEYEWMGNKEIYSDMFFDCFGLLLSHLDGEELERLICATCVTRLRDASAFRKQVLQWEEILLQTKIHIDDGNDDKVKLELVEVKTETSDGGSHSGNDMDAHSDTSDIADPFDDAIAAIKAEPINALGNIETGKLRRSLRNKTSKKLTKKDENAKAKKQMLLKMKRMKEKLSKIQDGDPVVTNPRQEKQPVSVDKDYNALRNAVTIVENSYVCPFTSVFSDYFCVYCREMFLDPDMLREHTLTHDPTTYKDVIDNRKIPQIDITRIDCRLCDTRIDDLDEFKCHITNIHGKFLFLDVTQEYLKFRLKLGSMNCIECDKNFGFFHALRKHMAEHFGTFICDVCGAHYFEEYRLILHRKGHENMTENFPCDECGKVFKSKNSRYFHIARIHKNEPAYPCNKCDEVLLSYALRYRHKMKVHGEKRVFPCEHCDKVYDSRKTLRDHNRKVHLQMLRHECTLCDKKFYLPSALKDHMTSHTGERNFRCECCGKSYPRLRALRVHMQSHSAEKKYKCTLCSASYTQINNYKNHVKTKHQGEIDHFPNE